MFIFRLILSIVPLALTPLLGFFIAEGYLNFGGGEKDLFLLMATLRSVPETRRWCGRPRCASPPRGQS